MDSMIGQTLGQYQLVEQIGKGGMATVYKAFQPGLNRYVAVKILPAYYAHEPGFAERFIREAQAIAKLDHPHILPVHDFGKEGDISYIVMKYVAAGSLRDKLGQPLAPAQVVEIIDQIAGALDTAHEQGILHRDVKPGNILLDERGWIYLSDFGLAKMVEGSVQLTGTGVGVGTPAYMSPEQGQGLPVDARTDVYALGVILFEMLTGQVPYEAETPMAVVIKHITAPIPIPRQINPNIPVSVERVLLKAMAKDREDRFPSAGAMAAALRQAVQGLEPDIAAAPFRSDFEATIMHRAEASSSAAQPGPINPPLSTPSSSAAPSLPAVYPTGPKKTPWLFVFAGIAALAIGGLGLLAGWLYFGSSEATPTPVTTGALAADVSTPTPAPTTPVAPTSTSLPAPTDTVELRTEGDELPQSKAISPTASPSLIPTATSTPVPPPLPTPIALLPTVAPIPQEVGLGVDNFEGIINLGDFVINRNAGNEGKVSLAGPPHLKQGQQALALEFDIRHDPPNHYLGFDREFPAQDWSSYTSLCVWVESDGSNRTLVVQFGESKYKFWKSVTSLATVGVGDTCVALQGEHQIDLSAVGYYGIYVEGPPPGQSVIYLDDVRVVKPMVAPPTPAACSAEPQGIFRNLWLKYKDRLGCPNRIDPLGGFYAEQPFQSGHMFWSKLGQLYLIVIGADRGTWRLFSEDESPWKEGMPPQSCQADPPPGLVQPIRGFGGLWCAHPDIRDRIGYGLADEHGFEDGIDLIQGFGGGIIFRDSDGYSQGLAYVLFEDDMTFVREAY
jgi:serine/threonine protein kinase